MPAPHAAGLSMAERLTAAADHARDCQEQYKAALKARNALIVEAVDDGAMSQREIARAAKMTQPHVIRLMSLSEPELELG